MVVPGEHEHSGSKTEALQMGPKTQNDTFIENGYNYFD
jgi:hypothetical protein